MMVYQQFHLAVMKNALFLIKWCAFYYGKAYLFCDEGRKDKKIVFKKLLQCQKRQNRCKMLRFVRKIMHTKAMNIGDHYNEDVTGKELTVCNRM